MMHIPTQEEIEAKAEDAIDAYLNALDAYLAAFHSDPDADRTSLRAELRATLKEAVIKPSIARMIRVMEARPAAARLLAEQQKKASE